MTTERSSDDLCYLNKKYRENASIISSNMDIFKFVNSNAKMTQRNNLVDNESMLFGMHNKAGKCSELKSSPLDSKPIIFETIYPDVRVKSQMKNISGLDPSVNNLFSWNP